VEALRAQAVVRRAPTPLRQRKSPWAASLLFGSQGHVRQPGLQGREVKPTPPRQANSQPQKACLLIAGKRPSLIRLGRRRGVPQASSQWRAPLRTAVTLDPASTPTCERYKVFDDNSARAPMAAQALPGLLWRKAFFPGGKLAVFTPRRRPRGFRHTARDGGR